MADTDTKPELDALFRDLARCSYKLSDIFRRSGFSELDPFPISECGTDRDDATALFHELSERASRVREAIATSGFASMPVFPPSTALVGLLVAAMQASPAQWGDWEKSGRNWTECFSALEC